MSKRQNKRWCLIYTTGGPLSVASNTERARRGTRGMYTRTLRASRLCVSSEIRGLLSLGVKEPALHSDSIAVCHCADRNGCERRQKQSCAADVRRQMSQARRRTYNRDEWPPALVFAMALSSADVDKSTSGSVIVYDASDFY